MKDFYFSKGNHKLSKYILVWNLPRIITCPGAGACKDWCYEKKVEAMYPAAVECRKRNYEFSKRMWWWEKVLKYLNKRPEPYVRIHECGDFYSERYFRDWLDIANVSKKIFFAYTKSFKILENTRHNYLNRQNLILFQSYGSKYDDLIIPDLHTARTLDERMTRHSNEKTCPYHKEDFTKCGEYCVYCMTQSDRAKHVAFRRH
jgi:hypothetical protein